LPIYRNDLTIIRIFAFFYSVTTEEFRYNRNNDCDFSHIIYEMERGSLTYVDTSNISAQMFITVLLFLLVIAPLFSLAILRFFQAKRKSGFTLIFAGVLTYVVFQASMLIFF